MGRYWDARAREDALYFVDSRAGRATADEDGFWRRGEEDLDRMLGLLGAAIEPSDRVVEIGCGVGRITRVLAARAAYVQALDVSAQMLREARARNPELENVEWLHGDGFGLAPIADASATVCFSVVVFQHIPDALVTLGYIRETGRILRPGGWAALHVSNDPGVHRLANGGGGDPESHPAWLGSAVDLEAVRDAATEAGMSLDRVVGAGTQWCGLRLSRAAK